MPSDTVLSLSGIDRHYGQGETTLSILKGADFSLRSGETVALVAPSGTGKSTLLHVAGLLEHPDAGEVTLGGVACHDLSDERRTAMRRHSVGFVYQFHHLLPEFSALENVAMPLLIRREKRSAALGQAAEILTAVGLGHRLEHRPGELSGGERQRAAIARALVSNPSCLLADEPTGNLDSHTASVVFGLLIDRVRLQQASLILVTHDQQLAARADRILKLNDGVLVS